MDGQCVGERRWGERGYAVPLEASGSVKPTQPVLPSLHLASKRQLERAQKHQDVSHPRSLPPSTLPLLTESELSLPPACLPHPLPALPPPPFLSPSPPPSLPPSPPSSPPPSLFLLPPRCRPLVTGYKFLFPFETRRRFFYCTSFGLARALGYLQQVRFARYAPCATLHGVPWAILVATACCDCPLGMCPQRAVPHPGCVSHPICHRL